MFRLGLLATLSALILTGCVSTYAYRDDGGGDYYYSEPEIEYYDAYGRPYGTIGYGYPGGWYFGFGDYYGRHIPYSRYGFPYGYYGDHYRPYVYPPYSHHHHGHRPPYAHRPPTVPPGTLPPGVIVDTTPPGGRPNVGNRNHDREGGPWRHLDRVPRRVVAAPQQAIPGATPRPASVPPPGALERPRRPPVAMSQPGLGEPRGGEERLQRPRPMPAQPAPVQRPRTESSRPSPPPGGRPEPQERESRREPEP